MIAQRFLNDPSVLKATMALNADDKDAVKVILSPEEVHNFEMGCILDYDRTFSEFAEELYINGAFRLPYRDCTFSFRLHDATHVLYCLDIETHISIYPYIAKDDYFSATYATGFALGEDRKDFNMVNLGFFPFGPEDIYIGHGDGRFEDKRVLVDHWASIYVDAILTFCGALASRDVTKNAIEVPQRINQKRERQGKRRIYDYVVVRPTRDVASGRLGGTHASPRTHWRRGHVRHWGDRLIPIAPCIVKPGDGVPIKKTYIFSIAEQPLGSPTLPTK